MLQLAGLYLVGEFSRSFWLPTVFIFWLVAGILLLVFSTVLLWLEIDLVNKKQQVKIQVKDFISKVQVSTAIVVCSVIVIIILKLIQTPWGILSFVSSIISSTATLAMLYNVLCKQPFYSSFGLALDTWNRKFSLAAIVAFIIIVSHGISFALAHGALKNLRYGQGFSVLNGSATIWILFLALVCLVSFIVAVLNSFLVLLFLETIERKKDPEPAITELKVLTISEARH